KGVVMRFIEVIPAQFLREKSLDSREITNLRQLPVVAKNIRIPKLRAANPEFFFEESLAGDELTAERFAEGILQSGSIQVPPTGTNCPFFTFFLIRSYKSGLRSLIT